jgi:hypothetical protein
MVMNQLPGCPLWRVLPIVLLGMVMTGLGQSTVPPGPAPGAMINVYGHTLHIHCVGLQDAKPVVIFEAGGGAFSEDWVAVQDLLAARFRTCAYDRAGPGVERSRTCAENSKAGHCSDLHKSPSRNATIVSSA